MGEFTLHQDLAKAQQWLSELLKSDSEMRREEEATGVQSLVWLLTSACHSDIIAQ